MIMDERLNPSPLTPLPQGARGITEGGRDD